MGQEVVISTRADLWKIIKDLQALQKQAGAVSSNLRKSGTDTTTSFQRETKRAETFLGNLAQLGRRVADRLRGDFKTLFSIEAIRDATKFTGRFKQAMGDAITIGDTIRKVGPVFGLAASQFASFQAKLIDGLGKIGAGGDEAARALEGLSKTQVRGEDNLLGYARAAAQLAQLSGTKGQEGGIAQGMAEVMRARGLDPNNLQAMQALAESLRGIYNATGQTPAASLQSMQGLFAAMSPESRKKLGPGTLRNLAAVEGVVGPEMEALVRELTAGMLEKLPKTAQGFGGIVGPGGIDFQKLESIRGVGNRIAGDKVASFKTAGFSDAAAQALVKLLDLAPQAFDAVARANDGRGNLGTQARGSMGLGEAFNANLNRVNSVFAKPIAEVTTRLTDLLQKTSESDTGASLLVGGTAALTALATGSAVRSLSGIAAGEAVKKATGGDVQEVFVVNMPETGLPNIIGGGGAAAASAGVGAAAMGTAGLLGLAGLGGVAGGVALGNAAYPKIKALATDQAGDSAQVKSAKRELRDALTEAGKSGGPDFTGATAIRLLGRIESALWQLVRQKSGPAPRGSRGAAQ